MTETRLALERVLGRSLHDLTGAGSRRPGRQLEGWDLPDDAKVALTTYGLPGDDDAELPGFAAEFQETVQPARELQGERYYVLGRFGSGPIGALSGSGVVRSVPQSFTPHPQLANLYPDGPVPAFVNASVPRFVECAWRYRWVLPLLLEERARAGDAEVQAIRAGLGPESPDFFAPYQHMCRDVLDRFRSIDPEIEPGTGFWAELINDVW